VGDEAVVTPGLLHVSLVAGAALSDEAGGRLGRVDDLIVRLEGEAYPPISGLLASVAGRRTYVPADLIADITTRGVTLRVPRLDLRPFERRPDEVLLRKDVLDRQLINVDGARLVRANEIEMWTPADWPLSSAVR
jgi:magnesium transporter